MEQASNILGPLHEFMLPGSCLEFLPRFPWMIGYKLQGEMYPFLPKLLLDMIFYCSNRTQTISYMVFKIAAFPLEVSPLMYQEVLWAAWSFVACGSGMLSYISEVPWFKHMGHVILLIRVRLCVHQQ